MPAKPKEEESPGQYWHAQLSQAQASSEKWETRGKKVVKRYRDERDAIEGQRKKFNILWSNVQVLTPSLYGRPAKPEVTRRYNDQDPIGRLASVMLERVVEYEVEQFPDYDAAMKGCVEDRLLPGRGMAWVRYDPTITKVDAIPEGAGEDGQITAAVPESEQVDAARSPIDYVYWLDFLHSPARTWDEVWWVARWVYMTRDEGIDRFGDVFKNVPCDSDEPSKDTTQKKASLDKKAKVAEIWDKRTGRVCWVAHGYPQQLDEKDDPLQLEGFFPCPRPLFATTTNGSLIPIPDFCEYEDQANELDSLTNRISMMVKAVKAVGVFNGEFKELTRLLSEGIDNKLFPVTAWAALAEKGGLKGAVDLMDITVILKALEQLYISRESVKQTIYEVMGISDILRGASNAQETLGAQQMKANFGSLRLRCSQSDVARFAADLFRLKAQIVCKFYPPELIVEMSGVMNMDEGKDPQLLQAAIQLLKDSTIRDFHIAVSSDSLAQIDDQAEQQAAVEVTTALGGFLKEALPLVSAAPETLPLVGETLLYTVRRFRAGRALESAIEKTLKALEAKAQQVAQQPPPPDPEMVKVQAQQAADQARLQADQQSAQIKAQMDMQVEQFKAQQAEQKMQHEAALKAQELQQADAFNRWKAQLEAETKIIVAQLSATTSKETTAMTVNASRDANMETDTEGKEKPTSALTELTETINNNFAQLLEAHTAQQARLLETLSRPRTVALSSGRSATIN
tara:strand:- start:409 stop:2628 length:2220 start_codon:yes stop_codon:yes gene_type:complete